MVIRVKYIFLLIIGSGFLLSSCMKEDQWMDRNKPNIDVNEILNERGLIILNEGNFSFGNSSLSYYNIRTGHYENDVFYRQNGIPLGDVAHSAIIYEGLMYLVVNNSGKMVTVNMGKYNSLKAFEFTGKLTGLVSPRYVKIINGNKAYISDLYAREITVFNPATMKITGKISTNNFSGEYFQHPTEQMVFYGKYMFTNCYSFDNKILVIDTITDQIVDSIEVFKQPSSMVMDKNGKLWVLCDGGYEGSSYRDEYPGLVRIDCETRTVEKVYLFNEAEWPRELCINGTSDTIYFINKDIWRMSVSSAALPEVPFITATDRLFYSLGVDPLTSEIYAGDAVDYVQQGIVYRYNSRGDALDSFRVGVSPGDFVFVGTGESK